MVTTIEKNWTFTDTWGLECVVLGYVLQNNGYNYTQTF